MLNRSPQQLAPGPPGLPCIWLVDDSALQAHVGKQALSSGHAVEVFLDGASMLEALGAGGLPDLLVLDWHMPGLSGLEVCTFIRQKKDAGELPILILTASRTPADLVEALEAGANDFVIKPFTEAELHARVSALLRTASLHARLAQTERRLRVEGEFRESFIGMLAHDLRQPLNTFVLANEILGSRLGGQPEPLLEMQRRTADRMGRMVRELLDFARSRPADGMPVDRRTMDMGVLVRALVEEFEVGHPSHRFACTVDGSCTGAWDRDRVAQLCSNLLGNAVEHGAQGTPIGVRVRRDVGSVVLAVSNGGEQIPADIAASIFEPFRRGRSTNKGTGVGLGLHIVSQIARAHGGSVALKSDPTSTVFEVALPLGPLSSRRG